MGKHQHQDSCWQLINADFKICKKNGEILHRGVSKFHTWDKYTGEPESLFKMQYEKELMEATPAQREIILRTRAKVCLKGYNIYRSMLAIRFRRELGERLKNEGS